MDCKNCDTEMLQPTSGWKSNDLLRCPDCGAKYDARWNEWK